MQVLELLRYILIFYLFLKDIYTCLNNCIIAKIEEYISYNNIINEVNYLFEFIISIFF
jgi:hypothetical protein